MKNPNLYIRTALATRLSTLSYLGTDIPVYEEYVQETTSRPKAILTIGNMQVEAYVILLNQTMNDNSSKCMRNDLCGIQVQICTVFIGAKGGSKTAELISEEVLALLFDADGLYSSIEVAEPLNSWIGEVVTIQNLNFDEQNSRTWITQLVLEYGITQ